VCALLLYAGLAAQPQLIAFAGLAWLATRRAGFVRTSSAGPFLGALVYVAIEGVLPRLFDVGLGVALHTSAPLRQLAAFGGIDLLTALVVAVNLFVWQQIPVVDDPAGAGRSWGPVWTAFALILGALSLGAVRLAAVESAIADASGELQVALVQGSVDNADRLAWARGDEAAADRQLDRYLELSRPLVRRVPAIDLLVWPEATFPGIFGRPSGPGGAGRAARFDRFALALDAPMLFGAYDLDEDGDERTLYNAIFAIEPDPWARRQGRVGRVQRYHKAQLLPFAESPPRFLEALGLGGAIPGLPHFGRGPGARLLPIERAPRDYVRIAPILCSESLVVDQVASAARLGADLLVNIGSDGWFGNHGEPELHLALASFRSIETGLPQVRAANTGLSALILSSGAVLGQTRFGERLRVEFAVPLAEPALTLVVRWGDWFETFALVVSLLAAFLLRAVGARSA
jgi:apolipoprotein N-acyltransferase